MDDQYFGYFESRLAELREQSPDDVTWSALDAATRAAPFYLRPDAQLALYVGFRELVVRPIDAVRPNAFDVQEIVARDMSTVVEEAAADAPRELSAHGVVNAISRSWDRLRSADWGIWD